MKTIPEQYLIGAAAADGQHTLTAFDAALIKIGIGDCNLVRVSSILPPGCQEVPEGFRFPDGSLVPTVYGVANSSTPGERVAAAVGIGFYHDSFGVIMEHSGLLTAEEARGKVEEMIREAFVIRGMELKGIKIKSTEHRVTTAGAAVAAVALW